MGRKRNPDYLKISDDDLLRLILLYQSEVCLYDPHFAGHKNREVKRAALERIAATLDIEGFGYKEIQYRLKNLKDCYAKELKKIEKSANSGMRLDQLYVPKVFWFPLLDQFLRPHYQPRTSSKSKSEDLETRKVIEIEDDSSEEEDAVETDYELDEDTATSSTVYQESKERQSPSPYGEPQAKRSIPPPSRTSDNETNIRDRFQPTREQTEFDVWAQSVAMQLNGMELRRALNLQLQIQTLISNERLSYEELKSANDPSSVAAHQAESRKRQQLRMEGHNGTAGQAAAGYFPMGPWDQVAPYMFMNDQMERGRGKHPRPQSDSTGENNVDIMSPFSQHSNIQPATTKR